MVDVIKSMAHKWTFLREECSCFSHSQRPVSHCKIQYVNNTKCLWRHFFFCPSNLENHGNCKYNYAKMFLLPSSRDQAQIVLTWREVHLMPISPGHFGAIFTHL